MSKFAILDPADPTKIVGVGSGDVALDHALPIPAALAGRLSTQLAVSGGTVIAYDPPAVPLADQLRAYANARQWVLATGGHTVTIAGVARRFATDPTSLGLVTGKALRFQQPNAPAAVNWQFDAGFVSIAAADFVAAATSVADFVQSTFDALDSLFGEIDAGTITTTAQIDAAFAALPG